MCAQEITLEEESSFDYTGSSGRKPGSVRFFEASIWLYMLRLSHRGEIKPREIDRPCALDRDTGSIFDFIDRKDPNPDSPVGEKAINSPSAMQGYFVIFEKRSLRGSFLMVPVPAE